MKRIIKEKKGRKGALDHMAEGMIKGKEEGQKWEQKRLGTVERISTGEERQGNKHISQGEGLRGT